MDHKAVNQCDLCHQFSYSSCSRTASSAPVCVGLYMLVAAVVLVTVCGNLLVIISICCFKHLHTPTNLLLLSLAVADLLVGLTVMPFHFFLRLESCWRLGTFTCKLFYMFSWFLPSLSVYNVAFIAVDRYFALHNPFIYTTRMTINVSLLVISIIWMYSLVYTTGLLYASGYFHMEDTAVCPGECAVEVSDISSYIDSICVVVLTSVIIVLYSRIFTVAKKHINAINRLNGKDSRKMNRSVLSEAKAALNLGIVVVVFLLCTIPYVITLLVSGKGTDPSLLDTGTNAVTPVLLNSAINPIIYALFYPWFRLCVRNILAFKLCHTHSVTVLFNKH